jgi:hypothetical protein
MGPEAEKSDAGRLRSASRDMGFTSRMLGKCGALRAVRWRGDPDYRPGCTCVGTPGMECTRS